MNTIFIILTILVNKDRSIGASLQNCTILDIGCAIRSKSDTSYNFWLKDGIVSYTTELGIDTMRTRTMSHTPIRFEKQISMN